MSGIQKVVIATAPPIPEHRKSIYEYYRMTFDEAGCPMKQTDSGMVFHPMLPPYLICDLILEFEKGGDVGLLQHAESILCHSFKHAEWIGTSLVFMYRPESGLSQHPSPFYSALTQTWYMKAICDLSKHVGNKYKESLELVFHSLQLPIEQGGVLVKKNYGWILEEYPTTPPLYTLNGWLTVLRMIIACRKVLDSFSIDYKELLDKNLDAVEHLLPLYDAEFCLNSRYQLTGFTRLRFKFDRPTSPRISDFEIDIPGEGKAYGSAEKRTNYRWENYLERNEGRILQFNIVLSLISFPEPNVFSCNLTVDKDCRAEILVAEGNYRPDMSAMPTERWRQISTVNLIAGSNQMCIDIPYDQQNLFAYPTNFKKKIGDEYFNAYHFVHIVDLAEIYAFSGRGMFRDFAMKWLRYYEQWEHVSALAEMDYSLLPHKYGINFREMIETKISSTISC
jgi:hypothetical protein